MAAHGTVSIPDFQTSVFFWEAREFSLETVNAAAKTSSLGECRHENNFTTFVRQNTHGEATSDVFQRFPFGARKSDDRFVDKERRKRALATATLS